MSQSSKINHALKQIVIKPLLDIGFTGEFPHYRKVYDNRMKKYIIIITTILFVVISAITIHQYICVSTVRYNDSIEKRSYVYNNKLFHISKKAIDFDEAVSLIKVGDVLSFGNYYDAEKQLVPVEWIVFEVGKQKVTLIAKQIVDIAPYNELSIEIPDNITTDSEAFQSLCDSIYNNDRVEWRFSSLRKWLNDSFVSIAFSEQEVGYIVRHNTKSNGGWYSDTLRKVNTVSDLVYIPNIKIAKQLKKNELLSAEYSPYAESKFEDAFSSDISLTESLLAPIRGYDFKEKNDNYSYALHNGHYGCYWLISPGYFGYHPAYVYADGRQNGCENCDASLDNDSYVPICSRDMCIGVRPMIDISYNWFHSY